MSITTEDRIAGPFASGTVLPFEFKVFEAADLRVIKTEADGTVLPDLTSPADFSVVLNPDQDDDAGGEVTLTSAITGGASVVVTSQVANTQPNTITNLGGFLPATLNGAFDRLCIQVQQLSTYINAALRFPLSDGGEGSAALPPAVLRAGQVLMFDVNGDATVGSPSSALVSAPMQPVVAASTLATAMTALGFSAFFRTLIDAANAAAFRTLIGAQASGSYATLTGAEALTNKSVNGVTLTTGGSASQFLNGAGTYTAAGVFTSSFTSTDQTITAAGALTLAHSLGVAPKLVRYELVCQTNEAGFTAGQVIDANWCMGTTTDRGLSAILDATNITIRYGFGASTFQANHATTGVGTALTNANWKLRVKAWA